jgi:hypothetical protein
MKMEMSGSGSSKMVASIYQINVVISQKSVHLTFTDIRILNLCYTYPHNPSKDARQHEANLR